MTLTHSQQLLEVRSGLPLDVYLETMSRVHTWRTISRLIHDRYGLQISHVTLHRWHQELSAR